MVVVDASAVVDALLGVTRVAEAIRHHELHAPVTIDAEVLNGLPRRWIATSITEITALTDPRTTPAMSPLRSRSTLTPRSA